MCTSFLVSCIADSTLGRTTPSSAATGSLARGTKPLRASRTPTLVCHLPFSRISSRLRNTIRVDSGGNRFRMALVAFTAAERTTSPLSAYKSKRMGSDGSNRGALAVPRIEASD